MADIHSDELEQYFLKLEQGIQLAYEVAAKARAKGFDPEETVPVPLAKDMAERVEGIVATVFPSLLHSGLAERIKELAQELGDLDWRVAFKISLEVAQEKFCKFPSKEKAMETGIRVGIAYLTLGIVSSPLEGFVELKIKKRHDGQEFFSLMFSGPIRSAGGTAEAASLVVADYVRVHMGYAPYDPTEEEVQRLVTEIYDYHDYITNLQYLPSQEEIAFLGKHLPVMVNGDPSEEREVSNFKDIPRIETNRIRSGICLVLAEGMAQKAKKVYPKLAKLDPSFRLEHWSFLSDFIALQKKSSAKGEEKSIGKVAPVYTYIEDLVAGRPVLTHPLRAGGFRLRYGRSRVSGYSAASIHPATMCVLDDYLATGTQLKVERPGKAASLTVCDSIEGPIVRLISGDVVRANSFSLAKKLSHEVEEILFMGDILFSYGDFLNRAHPLIPPGYCEEWWIQELEKAIVATFGNLDTKKLSNLSEVKLEEIEAVFKDPLGHIPGAEAAIKISLALQVPLHPYHTYHWGLIDSENFHSLLAWISQGKIINEGSQETKLVMPLDIPMKKVLELAGIPHTVATKEFVVISGDEGLVLKTIFKLGSAEGAAFLDTLKQHKGKTGLELINLVSPFPIRDKSGHFIGARMGRPEKAKARKLTGSPHSLFPVGQEGGKMRSMQSAIEEGKITAESRIYRCTQCNTESLFGVCETCGKKTKKAFYCQRCGIIFEDHCPHGETQSYQKREIDIAALLQKVQAQLGDKNFPDLVKGVRGTSNKDHIPEHLGKGLLRAKHNIYVNKDGTTRYDCTQLPITHFKPFEIGTSVEKLIEMGYTHDIHGNPLTHAEQVLGLLPQDVVLPSCPKSPDEGAEEILFRTSRFIDDLLVKLYGLEPFYCLKSKQDIVGHLINALAPHISATVVGRIIGFSQTQGFFAHPMLHAATRRDCDGDEASVTLLLDTLLNFSPQFLPANRGSTQDAPLVMTSRIIVTEVDDMVFDLDVAFRYPLSFYEAALKFQEPGSVAVDRIKKRLNTPLQYEKFGYTHESSNINAGVLCSAYKTLPSMEEKLKGQMILAQKIRAVDEADVARLVIERHFIRDIKGNLRKFSQQEFRCVACNGKFRRPPLIGKCINCGGKLIFTISEGSIIKYLEPAISLASKYNLPAYIRQNLELTKRRVEGIFGKETEKQIGLGKWFG
ncbi:DNA polymerase II large subunit [Candidatus Woesearchaeota archaeon]|nr:DNA polymerase II large subunit [Candidatus Woesearchaeota archaeon]